MFTLGNLTGLDGLACGNALHGVGFASAGRPVNKYVAILAIEEGFAQVRAITVFKDFLLCSIFSQHLLERADPVGARAGGAVAQQDDLGFLGDLALVWLDGLEADR